jgi:hypothetical protein
MSQSSLKHSSEYFASPQSSVKHNSEICTGSLHAGFDKPVLEAHEIELDDKECVGLLKIPGLLQNMDDFCGCPVKPQSLVATSKLMILASSQAIMEVRANSFRCDEG